MSGMPSVDATGLNGWVGVLRSWLKSHSNGHWPSPGNFDPPAGRELTLHGYGSVRVLVVDDNPVNLMLISALLEPRGLVPCLAADGAEAVALACEWPFDLILMDVQMPILDGLAATSAIRRFESQNARPAVPVVAYSSCAPAAGLLVKHGFSGSLSKPCEDHELDDCLVRWCPSYRSAPAARGGAPDNGRWQPGRRSDGAGSASWR